ncbi:MAG: hypothetical protein WBW33_26060 [Bryobacteraceae bacterium]
MSHNQATAPETLDGPGESDAFLALDVLHTQLRHAVEDRNYGRIQDLVAQQRAVFEQASPQHAGALHHAVAGRDLVMWALTMVRLQRAHDQRALLELVTFKKALDSYEPRAAHIFDCLAEG